MKKSLFENSCVLGHSENKIGESEPLSVHLKSVALLCSQFAKAFGCEDEGYACGLFHDLGKLGPAGQDRIRGIGCGVDHWSYGAHRLLDHYKTDGVAAAFCALAHHQGLGWLNNDVINHLLKIESLRKDIERKGRKFSEVSREKFNKWISEHQFRQPEKFSSIRPSKKILTEEAAAVMADIRMLFSALVDADFLETEAHFRAPAAGKRYRRPESPRLEPERALRLLLNYIELRRHQAAAPQHIIEMRDDLLAVCRRGAQGDPNVFTLSAPTGSGKTLAMLAFALEHAVRNDLRRVVLVVPYLSIIEQTARVYREIFEGEFGPHYILEHHSLALANDEDNNERTRLLSENWDAPVIITTSVQFYESLFSNRPSACRKLHRLARGVVLFDEVQTFPVDLAIPTLATVAHMARCHKCTTVFATATQPAFSHFHEHVQKIGGPGWHPHEIVTDELKLFERAKRTRIHWPQAAEKTGWDELARKLSGHERVLCVVNLKRHAKSLVEHLRDLTGPEGLFHLSTNMCPAHRENALRVVRQRLGDKLARPCRLIATQCVEAGVDIDFPVVFRAMGPLEAIAQAAGRCNRNGRQSIGEVHVFIPNVSGNGESNGTLYPSDDYKQAAMWAQRMLESGEIDLDRPEVFDKYYRGLYDLRNCSDSDINKAVKDLHFEETAKLYRLIKQQTVNLVVPYDKKLFDSLNEEAQEQGLSVDWMRRARSIVVSIYGKAERLAGFATPVRLPDWAQNRQQRDYSDEWFMLPETAAESYDHELLGLAELPKSCLWIA